jgi:lysophospholipase L1-like esterase
LLAAAPAALGATMQSVELALTGAGPYTLYFPELWLPEIDRIEVLGGALRARPARPRWLAYGDSITEGWCASAAALCWTARAARQLDLDILNFGYSGAARGEIAAAEMLAKQTADVITVAFGTNCWSRVAHDGDLFAATLRTFLQIVRAGQPHTPIVAISPTLRPDGEQRANARGLTHAQLRHVFERTVQEKIESDDYLYLIEGLPLVNVNELAADGIHPNDAGHANIADAVTLQLRAILGVQT